VITSTPATREEHQPSGLLDGAIASFLKQLQAAGYAKKSLRDKRAVVRTFADWLRRSHITLDAINESHVAAFLKRTPGTLPPRLKYKHAALSGFLKYLRRVRLQPSCRDACPNIEQDFYATYDELTKSPVPVPIVPPDGRNDTVSVDGDRLVAGIRERIRTSAGLDRIPLLLHELRAGD
jgi:hypothetical protein